MLGKIRKTDDNVKKGSKIKSGLHCTLSFYAIFSTAVAFSVHTGAVLVLRDKVALRVADGRSVPLGDWDRGEGRQKKCRPTVTKVFGVRGQESICSGLRGHCFAGRDLLPWWVLLSSACGWVALYPRMS